MRSLLLVGVSLLSFTAHAFCGFYVSGAGGKLFNDASMVVLVRDGTKTVLSMQNNYRGPTEDFALVIPVPVVLTKDAVKTIPKEAFTRVDELTSPRLVEQQTEQCGVGLGGLGMRGSGYGAGSGGLGGMPRDLGVKVEAKFEVEEYEIVILSAQFSLGLEVWLKENKYQVPDNAAPLLQPYVQQGSKFFVAKVNAKKAKFQDGHLTLSPLRFSYDSEQFSLPVRLGLVNSSGSQDLIVHIIAKDRYELANMKNVTIPTNFDVRTRTQPQFGGFYKELLDRTFKKNPGAAVTEFAWQGALPPPTEYVSSGIYGVTCDPCPPPHPVDNPLGRYLGVAMLPKIKTDEGIAAFAQAATVTRLHLRLNPQTTEDLVFKVAPPIHGGIPEAKTVTAAKTNRFQGRYVMWVDGCSGLGGGGMFSSAGIGPLHGPSAESTKMIDPFEQLIVADLPELDVKAVPLAKDAPKVVYTPPQPVQQTWAPPPAPTVNALEPIVGEGLEKDIVKRIVARNRGQIRFCYERELSKNPSLRGKVVVQFEISASGNVPVSAVASSTVGDPEVDACFAARVRTWQFPKPKEGVAAVRVVQPFVLSP
ncbi:MAG: TonB family protein [Archangium sp.]